MAYIEVVIKLYGEPTFSVLADNSIKMELKGSAAGGSISLYTSDFNLMYYCIRYGKRRVNMLVSASVVMKAWITNDGKARAKLQGSLESVKREKSRVGVEDLPPLTEVAGDGADVTQMTEYCVRRFVAANWATNTVGSSQGRSLDSFITPLLVLHNALVAASAIDDESIVFGTVLPTEELPAGDDENEAERLRALTLRQMDASRVQVAPLPSAFLLVNANLTLNR